MADLMDAIKKILHNHGYIVKVCKTDTGIIAHFPKRLEQPVGPSMSIKYVFDYLKNKLHICTTNKETNDQYHMELDIPKYVIRPCAIFHIIRECKNIHYHLKLIAFYIKDDVEVNEKEFSESFQNLNKREQLKEKKLMNLVAADASFPSQFMDQAKEHNILKGYQIIKSLFTDGTMEQ